jgi:hypothetical protein
MGDYDDEPTVIFRKSCHRPSIETGPATRRGSGLLSDRRVRSASG